MGVSGISTGFPVLSQSSGQVAHVLLTRSPLDLRRCKHQLDLVRLACVRHAASVRPEPGSNSPSRLRPSSEDAGQKSESRLEKAHLRSTAARSPEGSGATYCFITFDSRHQGTIAEMPPALAFGSHSSVFKEQPRTGPRWAEVRDPCQVRGPGTPSWLLLERSLRGGVVTLVALFASRQDRLRCSAGLLSDCRL